MCRALFFKVDGQTTVQIDDWPGEANALTSLEQRHLATGDPVGEKNITTKSSAAGDPCADLDASAPSHADEAVILVHGLWTPATVFLPHAHWLKQRGYTVRRFAYPSVRTTLLM